MNKKEENSEAEVKYDSKILSLTLGAMEAMKDCLLKKDTVSHEYKLYKDFFTSGLSYFERLAEHRKRNDLD
jgi:hypothetical protein